MQHEILKFYLIPVTRLADAGASVPLPQPISEVLECLSHEEGWHVVSLGAGLIHIVQAGETIFPAAIGLHCSLSAT